MFDGADQVDDGIEVDDIAEVGFAVGGWQAQLGVGVAVSEGKVGVTSFECLPVGTGAGVGTVGEPLADVGGTVARGVVVRVVQVTHVWDRAGHGVPFFYT